MKKIMTGLLAFLFICSSCGKENTAGFEIECAAYTFTVNDCTINGHTGSSIDISLCIDSTNLASIKMIRSRTQFEGKEAKEFELLKDEAFLVQDGGTKLFIPWCTYFNAAAYTDHYYTIVTNDDKETNEIHLRIERPEGAL